MALAEMVLVLHSNEAAVVALREVFEAAEECVAVCPEAARLQTALKNLSHYDAHDFLAVRKAEADGR